MADVDMTGALSSPRPLAGGAGGGHFSLSARQCYFKKVPTPNPFRKRAGDAS